MATQSKGIERGHRADPEVHARLRRPRALRRRLRHLQHALDHGRATHARARHAAHARRVSPPGARLGRCSSRSSSASSAPSIGLLLGLALAQGPRPRSSSPPGQHPGQTGAVLDHAHRRRLAARRRPDHARRRALPRAPRDERAADRGGARGRRSRASPLAPYAPHDRRRDDRARRGLCSRRHVRARPLRDVGPAPARARLPRPLRRRRADLARLVKPLAAVLAWPAHGSPAQPAGSRARTRSAIPAGRP